MYVDDIAGDVEGDVFHGDVVDHPCAHPMVPPGGMEFSGIGGGEGDERLEDVEGAPVADGPGDERGKGDEGEDDACGDESRWSLVASCSETANDAPGEIEADGTEEESAVGTKEDGAAGGEAAEHPGPKTMLVVESDDGEQ